MGSGRGGRLAALRNDGVGADGTGEGGAVRFRSLATEILTLQQIVYAMLYGRVDS